MCKSGPAQTTSEPLRHPLPPRSKPKSSSSNSAATTATRKMDFGRRGTSRNLKEVEGQGMEVKGNEEKGERKGGTGKKERKG